MSETQDIEQAVAALRRGAVVAIPTETVYGLAADARNPHAIAKVFAVKQRPTSHPLIVHLGDAAWLDDWAVDIPESARVLARTFWPGPLTMVLDRHPDVLPAVTGGQDSVAIRMPNHALTLRVLRAFGGPVVAPSANRFTKLSPTSAEDVRAGLGNAVDFILDGGPCRVGVESTIVDLRGGGLQLLRPGAIDAVHLATTLHRPVTAPDGTVRVPGQHPVHYAPNARVMLVAVEELAARALAQAAAGRRVGVLWPGAGSAAELVGRPGMVVVPVPATLEAYASALYRLLRDFDRDGCDVVVASLPDAHGIGAAIRDRLTRAAGPRS